ncbi:MAG: hypothetical protein MUF22_01360 [Chitinispirillaceae bacterium]|jgi:methionyl-tRNA formyltransferase|nr:hypothetical protein [Chitinispirillaceae bacterium]
MNRISIACFGLTGFGNDLLAAVRDFEEVTVTALYTRKTNRPFRYYACEPVESLAEKMRIPVVVVPEKGPWDCTAADLAIVSSFHRIFSPSHLSKFRHSINIHPSLLPRHRGATPTNWTCRKGETITGLTAHTMDADVDSGSRIYTRTLLNPFMNDNQLRKALSFLSRELVSDIIRNFPEYAPLPARQDDNSYECARNEKDAVIKLEEIESIQDLINHIKAFTNYPMPGIQIGKNIFTVDFENPEESVEFEVEGHRFSVLGYWSNQADSCT